MIRNDIKLTEAILNGIVKFDPTTPCTSEDCDKLLLSPAAFNPTSRIDNQLICDACRSWEMIHNAKYPETGVTQ
jgi:hypothetical protein